MAAIVSSPTTPTEATRSTPLRAPRHGDLLKVSAYDHVASLLVALLVLVGALVSILVVIWITNQVFTRPPAPEMFLVEDVGEGLNTDSPTSNMDEPGIEELNLAEPDVNETLAAVTDAVSSVAASLDAMDSSVSKRGSGTGDSRQRGSSGLIPRWQRWEIRYVSTTLEAYTRQLGFFGIELGAIGGGQPTVDYARFEGGRPTRRTVPAGTSDERLYFIWRSGKFKDHDRSLLSRAGVTTTGRIICQFYPEDVENQLALLESQALGSRDVKQVAKTLFGIRPAGRGFEFHVLEVQWR